MTDFTSVLRDLLTREKELYAEAAAAARSKREAVVKNEVAELDRLVRAEQGLLVRLQAAERRRADCVRSYAAHFGKQADLVTLAEMVENAPEGERAALALLHGELRALLEGLLVLNEENRLLVESKLKYTRYMLSVLNEEKGSSHTYSARGDESDPDKPPQGLLDFSV